jgi:hypothetical protein
VYSLFLFLLALLKEPLLLRAAPCGRTHIQQHLSIITFRWIFKEATTPSLLLQENLTLPPMKKDRDYWQQTPQKVFIALLLLAKT